MEPGLSFQDRAGIAVGAGLGVAGLAGAVEHLILHPQVSLEGARGLGYALGLYGALGSAGGLALAVLSGAVPIAAFLRDRRKAVPFAVSFHVALCLLLLVGYRVNARPNAPPAGSSGGIVINGLLLIAVAVVVYVLAFLLGRIPTRTREKVIRAVRPLSPLLIAVPILLVLSCLGFAAVRRITARRPPPAAPEETGERLPHVVLLLIHGLRGDHVSGYGYEKRTTLALDHLMDESVTFDNVFAASNGAVPSVASILTGMTPGSHGVLTSRDRLPENVRTLAEVLAEVGYMCGAFVGSRITDVSGGSERGFHFHHPGRKPFWCFRLQTAVERIAVCSTRGSDSGGEVVLGKAGDWIEKNRSRPLFAYIHLMEPGSPYEPPPPYDTLFDPDYDGRQVREPPVDRATADAGFRNRDALETAAAAIPERRRLNMIALYDGEIAYTDQLIERFLKRIEALGLYENAMIVVTADHGQEFYDHGGWLYGGSLYDELIRVPLIVKRSGRAGARTRRRENASGIDIFPTIISAAGLPVPRQVEGMDVFGSHFKEEDRFLFPERPPFLYSAIEGAWKLIMATGWRAPDVKLFNLDADRGELRDLADRRPDLRDRLAGVLEDRAVALGTVTDGAPNEDLDSRRRERLKALGYIQ